jgi:hypothetical protein
MSQKEFQPLKVIENAAAQTPLANLRPWAGYITAIGDAPWLGRLRLRKSS